MTADELRAHQAPIKARYKEEPAAARVTEHAIGRVDQAQLSCTVPTWAGDVVAGMHPAAGGDGEGACSGDMLLQALVACAGVTLAAVANAMGITLNNSSVSAEGVIDFRGTLGVSKETRVGFESMRVTFHLDTEAPTEQLDKLVQLTERYCVIFQTLKIPPTIEVVRS
jgi:uncharacterized OsmC-like protein